MDNSRTTEPRESGKLLRVLSGSELRVGCETVGEGGVLGFVHWSGGQHFEKRIVDVEIGAAQFFFAQVTSRREHVQVFGGSQA